LGDHLFRFDFLLGFRLVGCEKTKFSVGGSEHRAGTPIYRNLYRYAVGGRTFESASYATGKCADVGSATIEYLPEQPEVSRIAGMRRNMFGPWVVLVAILPLKGMAFITVGLIRGRSRLRLLGDGVPVSGKLVEKKPTLTRINNRTVYQMAFAYVAHDGVSRRTVTRTHQPERLEDQPGETVLYDPDDAAKAMISTLCPARSAWMRLASFKPAHGRFSFCRRLRLPGTSCGFRIAERIHLSQFRKPPGPQSDHCDRPQPSD